MTRANRSLRALLKGKDELLELLRRKDTLSGEGLELHRARLKLLEFRASMAQAESQLWEQGACLECQERNGVKAAALAAEWLVRAQKELGIPPPDGLNPDELLDIARRLRQEVGQESGQEAASDSAGDEVWPEHIEEGD